ncbi:MAG: hypothetical protein L0207_00965 [Chlamydiae bacterium]|nr:hypothetical protein [Chlamydiota bacterium]
MVKIYLFAIMVLCMASCGPSTSDSELATIPFTNNPNIIQDSQKGAFAPPPGMNY